MRRKGSTKLGDLLRRISPRLAVGEYVFCTLPPDKIPRGLAPRCTFREAEGTSLICRRVAADQCGLRYDGAYRLITLAVNSPLAAVGFLAVVSAELAEAGIACNAVSAFHHDHLFVPSREAGRALALLKGLSKRGDP
jgi:uncharacterized protein